MTEDRAPYTSHGEAVIDRIFAELRNAEAKHPHWPDDKIHAVGILVEEAGEAMKAAIDYTYSGGDIEEIRTELAQTGAMAIRALLHLLEPPPANPTPAADGKKVAAENHRGNLSIKPASDPEASGGR